MSGSTYTPNFRLQKPPFDVVPWDQAVNGNMDIIDSALAKYLTIPNFVGAWKNATGYNPPQTVTDSVDGSLWQCIQSHTSASPTTTFAQDRAARPNLWTFGAASTLNPGVVIRDTAPDATNGTLWWCSLDGQMYVRYDDGTSQQWVTASNIGGFPNVATKDDVAAVQNNIGRNLLHNPLFNVAQRGGGTWTTPQYTADRWAMYFANGSMSINIIAQNDAGRTSIGDEASTSVLQCVFTGSATAGSLTEIYQSIEGVRRLAGKTVTVSFWAWGTGTTKLGIEIDQSFGTGGSPSATVNCGIQGFTITTTPVRYSVTLTLPSVSGKTLGANGNDATSLIFIYSSQVIAGIGVNAGTVWLWGVQLEVGTVMTPLEKPDPADDLRRCMRFYQVGTISLGGYVAAGNGAYTTISFPVPFRTAPTVVPTFTTQANCGTSSINPQGTTSMQLYTIGTALGSYALGANFTASADL